jgi:hypothetical protein
MPVIRRSLKDRFWSRVQKAGSSCWLWTGTLNGSGYGVLGAGGRGGKLLRAHRVAWEFHKGPIPDGLHCLHRCDNPRCVNVDHLFLGTNQDNIADRVRKGRSKAPIFRGEDHAQAKLSNDVIRRIREDGRIQRVIAADYGLRQSDISRIKLRQAWKHVDGEVINGGIRGGALYRAKLTEDAVRRIRLDGRGLGAIAADYGVCKQSISAIKLRQTWKHVA